MKLEEQSEDPKKPILSSLFLFISFIYGLRLAYAYNGSLLYYILYLLLVSFG